MVQELQLKFVAQSKEETGTWPYLEMFWNRDMTEISSKYDSKIAYFFLEMISKLWS
jgi:hypothetical protein